MKTITTWVLCLILAIPVMAIAQAPNLEAMDIVTKSVPDGPVARVGKTSINRIDFLMMYQAEIQQFRKKRPDVKLTDVDRVQIGLFCMALLVEHELLYQEAKRNNLTVPQDEVNRLADEQYNRLKKSFTESAQREVTEAEILDRLGYTKRSDFNKEVERSLLITKLRKDIVKQHAQSIPEADLEKLYEKNKDKLVMPDRVRLRQIFVRGNKDDEAARAESQKKADKALGQIFAGKRFEEIAKEYSNAPDASKGGDMGFVPTRDLLPVMQKAISDMQPEDVSDVLESQFGFHIVQLVEKRSSGSIDKDKAMSGIRNEMAKRQSDEAVREYCDSIIRSGTRVQIFVELEENLARISGESLN